MCWFGYPKIDDGLYRVGILLIVQDIKLKRVVIYIRYDLLGTWEHQISVVLQNK